MIKFLGLLFTFTFIYSEETIYILPDHHSRFIHQLGKALKKSSGEIIIVSPSLNHSELKKEILQSAKRGNNIKMILSDLRNDPLSMVQYDHINLYHTSYTFNNTTLIIDNSLVCTFSGTIEEDRLKSTRSHIRCSDEPRDIELVRRSLKPLMKYSKPYLK
jgi:hypothetical protein